jgi:D-alanine-D-alanine ligase-like ATP-grasp enzyme
VVAETLGIEGFARIDAFMHADTGEIIVIEANTVPGMTPSTVLYHQARYRSVTLSSMGRHTSVTLVPH